MTSRKVFLYIMRWFGYVPLIWNIPSHSVLGYFGWCLLIGVSLVWIRAADELLEVERAKDKLPN